MKKHIEYQALKNLGASEKALNFYSTTDPFEITENNGIYTVTGAFEFTCDSAEELLESLDELAGQFED